MGLIQRTAEASKSGFKAIEEFEGTLLSQERVTNQFTSAALDERGKPDLAEITFGDVVITKMDGDQPAPELKEGKFSFLMSYALPGVASPGDSSFYVKGYLASFEAVGKTPNDFIGQRCRMVKKTIELFTDKKTKQVVTSTNFVYAGGSPEEEQKSILEYTRRLVAGLNAPAAARAIARDARTKNNKELVAASRNNQLAEVLGMDEKEGLLVERAD